MSREELRVVLVSAPNREVATRLAHSLVEERLAACVNVVPGVQSVYRWQGRVEQDDEILLFVKTAASRCEALAQRIDELHPYDLPEVVALPVEGGSDAYLAWVETESKA